MQQLTKEQQRTQELLAELKQVKSDDAREITRLKKELATVRAVLRSYILQVDSLQRMNTALASENEHVKAQYNEATAKNIQPQQRESKSFGESGDCFTA